MHIQTIQTMIHVISGTHEKESEEPDNNTMHWIMWIKQPLRSTLKLYINKYTHRHKRTHIHTQIPHTCHIPLICRVVPSGGEWGCPTILVEYFPAQSLAAH